MFSYSKIISQAWAITTTRKFLWWFGLALFSGVAIDLYTIITSPDFSQILPGVSRFSPDALLNFKHAPLVFIVLLLIWILVYFRSKASMIMSVGEILDKKEVTGLKTFGRVQDFLPRLLGISIASQVVLGLITGMLFAPVSYLFSKQALGSSIFLGVTGGLLFAAFFFVITMASIFGAIFVVALKMKFIDALKAAIDLVGALWKQMLFMGLLAFGVWVLGLTVASLASAPFVIFAVISYHTGGSALVPKLFGLASVIVFLGFSAITVTMYYSTWIVYFSEVVKTPKTEDEVSVPEAEIVS